MKRLGWAAVMIVAAGMSLPALSTPSLGEVAPSIAMARSTAPEKPPVNAPADYQIGGAFKPAADIGVVLRDRTDDPAPNRYNICYVNAFQVQPGELKWWKKHHPGLLLRKDGKLVIDGGWNEALFNIRSHKKRTNLLRIQSKWIKRCAKDGYRGIEYDNLDSWTRSKKRLKSKHAQKYAKKLTATAHRAGLAAAQKNAASLTKKNLGFDFAIVEECQTYNECEVFEKRYRNNIIEIEYRRSDFTKACQRRGNRVSVILRDYDVSKPGQPGYVNDNC